MSQPTVCCVMLTKDRPELARRAVECFRKQTYENKRLLILDSGDTPSDLGLTGFIDAQGNPECRIFHDDDWLVLAPYIPQSRWTTEQTIGSMRNAAVSCPTPWATPDIIVHWDDDDWSHPRRIEEQVALLQATGADVVGYNQMLFSRESAVWLYSNRNPQYALGTSFCYWRKVWESRPFPHTSSGEDEKWRLGLRSRGVSSIVDGEPRMIARIHGGNTCSKIEPEREEWRRAIEYDDIVRRTLA